MQFDRDDGDYRSSDDLDLSFDFQEAEGDDRKARDEDQDSWDKEQGAGEAADEPGGSLFFEQILQIFPPTILWFHPQFFVQFLPFFEQLLQLFPWSYNLIFAFVHIAIW